MLIGWNGKDGEFKILFCHPRGLTAYIWAYRKRVCVIYRVESVCRWLSQWLLVFVLLWVDATLSGGGGIW